MHHEAIHVTPKQDSGVTFGMLNPRIDPKKSNIRNAKTLESIRINRTFGMLNPKINPNKSTH